MACGRFSLPIETMTRKEEKEEEEEEEKETLSLSGMSLPLQ